MSPVPVPREVLVVEDRHTATAFAEHPDDLLKELIPRIEPLPLLVGGVVAVFADQQHPVNVQAASAAAQRLGNRRIDFHLREVSCPFAAEFSIRLLVGVDRHQFDVGDVVSTVPTVPVQVAVEDVLRVRVTAEFGDNRSDARAFHDAVRREVSGGSRGLLDTVLDPVRNRTRVRHLENSGPLRVFYREKS